MVDGDDRKMGLGSVDVVTLTAARKRAADLRAKRRDGVDPIAAREEERRKTKAEAAKQRTFKQCADAYIKANESTWKNDKHAAQWRSTFNETQRANQKFPAITGAINEVDVRDIDVAAVMKVLKPIWYAKPETASRVRGRIERVLAWATVSGLRQGDNPARWTGNLKELLPAKGKVAEVEHHEAVPYRELGAFMADLRAKPGVSARALEFCILGATRTGEIIGAKWEEINLDDPVWTIPGDRMKAGREHAVPLSRRAVEILGALPREGDYVFPGARKDKPLSNVAMLELLRGMRGRGATVHGFRSTFRDWAGNETNFPRELAEHAPAHVIGDKAEQAYRRSDALERRRKLMDAWARYLSRPAPTATPSLDNVVSIRESA